MRLTRRSLAAYGQIALPLSIADLPLVIYLTTFYGTDLGVSLQDLAWVLLVARLSDVVIDPLIGIASDRSTGLKLGRRKAWVLLGIPLKMAGIYMVFFAAPGVGPLYLLVWLMLLYLGWTMIQIPYGAWGAEISGNYAERTRITGWRTLFAFVGIMIATLAPVFTGGGAGTPQGLTPVMQGLGLWALILFPVSGLLMWLFVPDRQPAGPVHNTGWLEGMKIAMRNAPFMRILAATTIGRIGSAVNTTVVLWLFIHALGLGANSANPVIVYLLAAVLGVPIWVWAGSRFSKHNALIFAVVSSLVAFACLLLVPKGDANLAMLIMALAGLGGGAAATLGLSISADVIDLDELRARRSRAGLLFAFWNMGGKLADAIGGFIALTILSSAGFNAMSPANPPEAIDALVFTYVWMPWPFFLVSVLLLWRFPIGRDRQARIRRLIERRAARAGG